MTRFAISFTIAVTIAAGSGAFDVISFALDTRAELQGVLDKVIDVQRR